MEDSLPHHQDRGCEGQAQAQGPAQGQAQGQGQGKGQGKVKSQGKGKVKGKPKVKPKGKVKPKVKGLARRRAPRPPRRASLSLHLQVIQIRCKRLEILLPSLREVTISNMKGSKMQPYDWEREPQEYTDWDGDDMLHAIQRGRWQHTPLRSLHLHALIGEDDAGISKSRLRNFINT